MKKISSLVIAAFALALGLAACGERDQVVVYKEGKYQGKPDAPPWDNEPLALTGSGTWTKGDRASWEEQIRSRQMGQHEDRRIYQ
jgi:ABC-type glycerol-3-phosphate transport system substrate-binding protein